MSRRASRSAMSRRRSWSCLPRASPSSSFALPRLRYIRNGTIVWPFCLRPAQQLVDLAPMEQQLPVPLRLVVVAVALLEGRDVGADQPGLALLDPGVGAGDVHLAGADRLDLGAGQRDAGLEGLLDRELMARFSVEGDGRIVAHGWLRGSEVGAKDIRRAHERRPYADRRSSCLPTHRGVRLDGHLLRGGAATRTVDHCTSPPFVPRNPTRRRAIRARPRRRLVSAAGRPAPRR